MPRFILFVYAGEADPGPTLERVQAMNAYNEELNRAGALLALDGLLPASRASRVRFKPGERPAVTDGPFTEAKELVGGYWIIQARSKEEGVEWGLRAPIGDGKTEGREVAEWALRAPIGDCTIEVRQIGEGGDYSPEVAEARKLSSLPPDQTVTGE